MYTCFMYVHVLCMYYVYTCIIALTQKQSQQTHYIYNIKLKVF